MWTTRGQITIKAWGAEELAAEAQPSRLFLSSLLWYYEQAGIKSTVFAPRGGLQTGLMQLTDVAQMRHGNVTSLPRDQKASQQTNEPFFCLTLQRFKHFVLFLLYHSVAAARRLSVMVNVGHPKCAEHGNTFQFAYISSEKIQEHLTLWRFRV